MYQALGEFLHRTTPELAAALCDGRFADDIASILHELGFADTEVSLLTGGFSELLTSSDEERDKLFHAVRRDYTHLFSNPQFSVMTLYESRFLGGEERDPAVQAHSGTVHEIGSLYKRAGFESAIQPSEYADHMRVEFEFMQVLRKNQGISAESGDADSYQKIEDTVQIFFNRHLKKWAVPFFEEVILKSKEDVYKTVARIAIAFFEKEFDEGALSEQEQV
jgi:TorA maturation chaperone TorD